MDVLFLIIFVLLLIDKTPMIFIQGDDEKKSLTLGVRVVGEDVGRNILIKGDSVQQFATIICRKKGKI